MKMKILVASLICVGATASAFAAAPLSNFEHDPIRMQIATWDAQVNQNQPGVFFNPCGWWERITVSGLITTDAFTATRPAPPVLTYSNFTGNGTPGTVVLTPTAQTGHTSDLVLSNANIFIDARVNNWVTANTSLVYSSLNRQSGATGNFGISNSYLATQPVARTVIDTAYGTIGNFCQSPIYVRVGKANVPFGGAYDPYGFVTQTNPTQLLTQTNGIMAQLGMTSPGGLYGSVYALRANNNAFDGGRGRSIRNGGLDLGYGFQAMNLKINLNGGYLGNIQDANYLASYYLDNIYTNANVMVNTSTNYSFGTPGTANRKKPAWNVNANVATGVFDFNAHYVTTTRNLAVPFGLQAQYGNIATLPNSALYKGKARAWGAEAGFTFPLQSVHSSRLAVGYQRTANVLGLLPQKRYYVDYMVSMARWFDMGLAVSQSKGYSTTDNIQVAAVTTATPPVPNFYTFNGSGYKSTTGQLRFNVKFA